MVEIAHGSEGTRWNIFGSTGSIVDNQTAEHQAFTCLFFFASGDHQIE
jgi:hypothetical protein